MQANPIRRARRLPRSRALAMGLGTVLVALLLYNCDSEGTLLGGAPCDSAYAGQCGTPCTFDVDCPSGLYCNVSGQCWADCTPDGGQCGDGVCDDSGRCQSGVGGSGGGLIGGNTGTGGNQGGACGSVEVDFSPVTPTVVLLIDQSGSMDEDFNGQQRWDVVYDVLMDPQDGVVTQLQSVVRFGLVLYTYSSGTCPGLIQYMPPALDARDAIDQIYGPEQPESNTPTGDSIAAITPDLVAFAEPGPKLIILATDGNPDRCEDPNGHDQASRDEATDAAEAAYQQGIEMVIIAVGDQVSQDHQQDMANAGQGLPVPADDPCNDPNVCAPTYEPSTQQAMIDAFMDIIEGQRTCVFTLDGEVIAGKECDGVVLVNGVAIPCNDPDGWQLNSASEIEFLGSTCDTIMSDPGVTITAEFPCDSVVPPPT